MTNCNLRTVSLAFVTVGFVVWSTNWYIVFGTRALSVARARMYYWHTTVNRKFIHRLVSKNVLLFCTDQLCFIVIWKPLTRACYALFDLWSSNFLCSVADLVILVWVHQFQMLRILFFSEGKINPGRKF